MVKDAEANAAADKKRRELVEARNQADALIYSTEKTVAELGDKVPAADKQEVERAIADLKAALGGEDLEGLKSKTQALTQLSMKLGEMAYKQQQEQPSPGAAAGPAAGGDDKVVDADFTEVDEGKRTTG
jgi:molecular chaperone DnaK